MREIEHARAMWSASVRANQRLVCSKLVKGTGMPRRRLRLVEIPPFTTRRLVFVKLTDMLSQVWVVMRVVTGITRMAKSVEVMRQT